MVRKKLFKNDTNIYVVWWNETGSTIQVVIVDKDNQFIKRLEMHHTDYAIIPPGAMVELPL